MNSPRIVRFTTGELVIFVEGEGDCEEGQIVLQNPHVMGNGPQGTVIVPLMPWARKGEEVTIKIPKTLISFDFPTNGSSQQVLEAYRNATSKLDLAINMGNVSPFVKN